MGLQIVKSQGASGGEVGGYIKTTTLKDYPMVVVRIHRYGTKPNYEKTGTNDYIVGDFLALDAKDKVVLSARENLWEISRSVDAKTGTEQPGVLFRILGANSPGDVVAGSIFIPDGKRYNVWRDADVSEGQLKVIEAALSEMGEVETQSSEGWANNGEELPDFLRG